MQPVFVFRHGPAARAGCALCSTPACGHGAVARACAVINCANSLPHDARMAMIDSGTTDLMFQHDNMIQQVCVDFDSAEAALGKSANSTFTTDGTATVGIGFDYDTPEGARERHNVTTRVTLCSNWNFDLVPPRWFQCTFNRLFGDIVLWRGDCFCPALYNVFGLVERWFWNALWGEGR